MRSKKNHTEMRFYRNREAFEAALTSGAFRGRAMHVTVLHDAECSLSRCVCDPEFVLEPLAVETYEAGRKAQAIWEGESVS